MKKVLLALVLVFIFYLVAGITIIQTEKEKLHEYLLFNQEGEDYFISYNEDIYYLAGFAIPEEITLKDDQTLTYLSEEGKKNQQKFTQYIETTFDLEIDQVIDITNKDYQTIWDIPEFSEIKNILDQKTEETAAILSGEKKYHPRKNVELLRVAENAEINTNEEMNDAIVKKLIELNIPLETITSGYIQLISPDYECSKEQVCTYTPESYSYLIDIMKDNVHLSENIEIENINEYREIN